MIPSGGNIAKRSLGILVVFWMGLGSLPSLAAEMKTPGGEVVLTVSGAIENTNIGDTAQFDKEMLASMPVDVIVTSTPWTEGLIEFTGVALADILDAVDAKGTLLQAQALNGYIVDIPVTDARDTGAIVAYMVNGEEIGIRDKGPLWVIYPFDSLQRDQELYFTRSIWQLQHLEVRVE